MSAKQRILVIGGGMAGMSLAYEASECHEVAVVEAEPAIGYHSTGRSAAMVLSGYGNATVRALTAASRPFLETPPHTFVDGAIIKARPTVYIAAPGEKELLEEPRYDGHDWLDVDQAVTLVPFLRREAFVAARIDVNSLDIDVDRLHQAYARGLRARGGVVHLEAGVKSAAQRHGSWNVQTTAGKFNADVVVNAAGGWCDEIADLFGAKRLGLQATRRTALTVAAPQDMTIAELPMVMTASEDLYFKPDAGLLLVSPADETPVQPYDAQPEEWDIAVAIDRLQQYCDVPVRRVSHSWAGLRTFAPDRSPILGFDPDMTGLFWCAGQGGYGIQIAPTMARSGAAMIGGLSLAATIPVAALSPSRFSQTVVSSDIA